MFAVALLFILSPFSGECNDIRRMADGPMNNEIAKILDSYVKPLSAKFPNHEVEVEVEFLGSVPQSTLPSTTRHTRRRLYIHKPRISQLRRAKIEGKSQTTKPTTTTTTTSTTPAPTTTTTPAPTTTTPAPTTPTPTPTPTTTTTTTTTTVPPPVTTTTTTAKPSTDSPATTKTENTTTERPIYMEDLMNALDAFEKKISHNFKTLSGDPSDDDFLQNQNWKSQENEPEISDEGVNGQEENQNIDRIIKILKSSGVQLQRNIPKPDDENLEWMRIKIPKDQLKNL